MNIKWVALILAALLVSLGAWGAYSALYNEDSYNDEPGVVYNNDGDGHDHDHGYFGVE